MRVPTSSEAALYAGISSGIDLSPESPAGPAAAFLSRLLAVRILLRLAARLNYARFLLAAGGVMLGGALWDYI